MTPIQKNTIAWTVAFTCITAAAVSGYGRADATFLGALLGFLLATAWQRFVLQPVQAEKDLGSVRLELNLKTANLNAGVIRFQRSFVASGLIIVWLAAVVPALVAPAGRAYAWMESHLRSEQAYLRIEYPSYLDAAPKELALKGVSEVEVEVDLDAYVSVQFRYRKRDSLWQVNLKPASPAIGQTKTPLPATATFGHSAKSIVEQLSLSPNSENIISLELEKNSREFAKQKLKITPQPRPQVELSQAQGGQQREGIIPLNVKARSKIPLSSVEFHVRTASGYRMVKPIAEFANANEQTFDGQNVSFNTQGIPFTPKDTLFIKAVAKTVAENIQGESDELKFEIVTRESIRQDLMQALEKSLQALQSNSLSSEQLKDTLKSELAKADQSARQMGAQSHAARQMEKITESSQKINATKDKAARETEKKIKNLLLRLKREQTANQVQNLIARLQNLKFSVQRSDVEQLPELSKDTNELRKAADTLKKQLSGMVEKPTSGLSLAEKQAALDALKLDRTPENLKDLERSLNEKKQNESMNQSQATLEHAQKQLGSVLAMLQAARQRAMREAREKLTRADNELQKARTGQKGNKESLDKSQQDLDSLPEISDDFQDAARDAQNGNQQARQGSQLANKQQTEAGMNEAQDGIVRALAALQDEEEAEKQSQQEQDGQSFRSAQEALAAQSQLDMGWRRQILEEIARLRAKGEAADSPAIQYLESRLR